MSYGMYSAFIEMGHDVTSEYMAEQFDKLYLEMK